MIYLPDTNVFSKYLRNSDAGLCDTLERELSSVRMSAIVLMELEYGVSKSPHLPKLRERVNRLRALFGQIDEFGEAAAVQTGYVRATLANLKPNAQPIGPYDALLAGQALSLGAVFVTHNTVEFSRVPGLRIEDWQTAK